MKMYYRLLCFVPQMYITCSVKAKGTRLAKPMLSLGLMCLAFLTGINRVVEYRNHWADVIAGFIIGGAIAVFMVRSHTLIIEIQIQFILCALLLILLIFTQLYQVTNVLFVHNYIVKMFLAILSCYLVIISYIDADYTVCYCYMV